MRTWLPACFGGCSTVLGAVGVLHASDRAPAAPRPFVVEQAVPRSAASRCSLVVASSRRLTTVDGRIVHVGVETAAARRADVLIAGNFAYTWPAGAAHDDPPIFADSIIGAVVRATGHVTLVPHPLPGRHVLHPHAADASRAGWHVVFAVSTTKDDEARIPESEPVALWYGLFDGRRWARLEQVAAGFVGARLWRSMSSELVLQGTELAFAFEVRKVADVQSAGTTVDTSRATAVVLLRRRAGRWNVDTLWAERELLRVGLIPGARAGEFIVALAGSFVARRPDGRWGFERSVRLVAAGPSGWRPRPTLVEMGDKGLGQPRVFRSGSALFATWVEFGRDGSPTTSVVKWAGAPLGAVLADSALPPVTAARSDTVRSGTNEFEVAPVPGGATAAALWVARDALHPDRLKVAVLHDGTIHSLASLKLSNHTRANPVAVAPGRFRLFTSEVAQAARRTDLPTAATFVHDLRLQCVERQP